MMFQLERRDNMFKKYDIIKLDNNIEYIIINVDIIDNDTYLLADRLDENEELTEDYQVYKVKNSSTKNSVMKVSNNIELTKIKKILLEKLAKK